MLSKADIDLIIAGQYQDVFAVLGPHCAGKSYLVRTLQPHATAVSVVKASGEQIIAMKKIHPDGLFEVELSTDPQHYRLQLSNEEGDTLTEDAYRYAPTLGDLDLYLIGEGTHERLYECLGSQPMELEGVRGVRFAVWAPNARRVSVVGPFNHWDGRYHAMRLHPGNGIFEIFIPGIEAGAIYKYEIIGADGQLLPLRSDPLALAMEAAPGNASIVFSSDYQWQDQQWMAARAQSLALDKAVSIYEVHLGSWRRKPEDQDRMLSYDELAEDLVGYVRDMGFTHIELLPITEHPFSGSWGYQPVGLFAPTCRHGDPDEFRYFIDCCHRNGIGVILDWVPAHFPRDAHGLGQFDGTALYEHADPLKGAHADWGTLIFNYGRREVRNYLIASALLWIDEYHIDALRVDAVASMLYLDYSRENDQWIPNEHGGNENLEAVAFLQELNRVVHSRGGITIAEESTAWPMVSRPVEMGGLGFTYKWNMGWMNDTLSYMHEDPVNRSYHHDKVTFGLVYAYHENFILPLSHDEVVHGKGSMAAKMPGDAWRQLANLRAYYAFMFAHPGKKLLFMGGEFAQFNEWQHDVSLDWHLLQEPPHAGIQHLVKDLNAAYRRHGALFQIDFQPPGFEWLVVDDRQNSVVAFLRRDRDGRALVAITNFTPVPRPGYVLRVPMADQYREILNTDSTYYGGSGVGNLGVIKVDDSDAKDTYTRISLNLPPLSTLYLIPE